MIAYIILISQQTVSVICGTARTLFKKLSCGDRRYAPLRLDIDYHPDATSSAERLKTNRSEYVFNVSAPITGADVINNDIYIVPYSRRTYSEPKYDVHYRLLADIVAAYRGRDTIDMIRDMITPSMNDKTIMLVVDVLAHMHKDLVRESKAHKRPRFSREQRQRIWANNLRKVQLPATRKCSLGIKRECADPNVELQADEIEEVVPDVTEELARTIEENDDDDQTLAGIIAERKAAYQASIEAVEAAMDGGVPLPENVEATPLLWSSFMDNSDEYTRTTRAALDSITALRGRYDAAIGNVTSMFGADDAYDFGDLLLPVAILMYNVHRARNITDSVVAVASFAERLSSRNGHARVRAAATWATSFIRSKNDDIMGHLTVLSKHFRSKPKVELQSSDYLSAFQTIANGITKSVHVKAFIYLTAFAFMGVTASVAGVAPDINTFSKEALEMANKLDMSRSTTGITVGLLTQSVQLCAELCTSFMRDGFQAFWSSDAKMLRKMYDDGRAVLQRASKFAICWKHKDMVQLGVDLKTFIDDYNAKKPKFDVYRTGAKFAGISFDSETNIATMWADVRKVAESVVAAHEDYKAILASVSFRMAPMCLGIIAGSSVGKSSVTQYFAKWFLLYEDMEDDMKYVYTVNPNQKFLDGYYPWQYIFVLDDVATVRAEYMKEGDPQVLGVIQYVNNIALLTNQADLSRKSNTPFLSRYVILTSNRKDLCAHKYANNYPAILRRVKWFITVEVDANYRTANGTLDQIKCSQWYTNGGKGIPPFWRYTVELCEVHNVGMDMHNTYKTVLHSCNYDQIQDWLRQTTDEHWRIQNIIMNNVSTAGKMQMCTHCKKLSGSMHGANCPHAGSAVQASIVEDVVGVGRVVAASVATAGASSGVIKILQLVYSNMSYCVYDVFTHGLSLYRDTRDFVASVRYMFTACIAFMADFGYTVALIRETIDSTSPVVRAGVELGILLSKIVAFVYLPWSYLAVLYFALSRVPSRTMVVGRVCVKSWLKPLVGLGLGLTAISALWYMASKKKHIVDEEHADEPDFSAFQPNPTWGQGRRKPYEGESLVTTWPTNSRCAAGSSHSGVIEKLHKNTFTVLVKSSAGATRGNGFVYDTGYVVVNAHTLNKHRGKQLIITLAYMPQERELGEPGDEKPRNYTIGKVDSNQIYYVPERDLAMIYMPMETRNGLKGFVLEHGSANYGMDPHLVGRDLTCTPFRVPVAYRNTADNVLYGEEPNQFYVKKCIHYNSNKELKPGHSGSIYIVHSGREATGEHGYIAVAGMHMGCANAVDGTVGFATAFDSKILSEVKNALEKQHTKHCEGIASGLGSLGPAYRRSVNLHSDVVVDDGVFDLEKGSLGGQLGATHPKSAVSWLDYNPAEALISLTVYGSVVGDSRKSQGVSSAYKPTPWSSGMCEIACHSVLGNMSNVYKPAKVNASELWQVHRLCLLDLCGGDVRGPDTIALDAAVAGYVSDVIQRVELAGNAKSWSLVQPLSYDEVINGRDGLYDGIVKKTGGGFGYSGPKHKHVKTCDEPIPGLRKTGAHWTFDDDVMASVREADEMLRKGIDPRFVYTCHLKDEVRTAEKVDAKKVRMICGASIPCIVLMRKYLLSLILFMQQNPVATECAVGLNVESRQWTDLANLLKSKGGTDRFIAGDYKSFDKNQTFPISYAASRAMLLMVEHANALYGKYSAEDMLAVRTILLGLCHPTYDFFGTLVRVLGTNPSGNTLTTQRNCIVNSLYMRCAFIVAAELFTGAAKDVSVWWYSKAVAQINYGDDIVAAVASGFPWFNHDVVAHIMRSWGITFTHADKTTDVGRPYDAFDEITFVKRSWVYDVEIDGYLAPLDPSSLVKSLHYYHQGNVLSTVQQQVCLIRDVAENALNYGRSSYDEVCDMLRHLAAKAGLSADDYREAVDFTTFDAYIERYAANSEGNLKFVGMTCDMAPPKLLDNLDSKLASLVAFPSVVKEGSFNPYGNGQTQGVTSLEHYPLNVHTCKVATDSPCALAGQPEWVCRPALTYTLVGDYASLYVIELVYFAAGLYALKLILNMAIVLIVMKAIAKPHGAARFVLFLGVLFGDVPYLWVQFVYACVSIFVYVKIMGGSFNPYGNGQWTALDVVMQRPAAFVSAFKEVMLPIIDALEDGLAPQCDVDIEPLPFTHVVYTIAGSTFAHIDQSSLTVHESMVAQLSHHGGYIQMFESGVHNDQWHGPRLTFPGLAAGKIYEIGGWQVRRRSACVAGEGLRCRVTRFECTKGDTLIVVGYFTTDEPRKCTKRPRSVSPLPALYTANEFRPRDGNATPPSIGGSPPP